MHFTIAISAVVALLPLAMAGALTPSIDELRQTNRVEQIARGKKVPGPVALHNLYIKYGKQAPAVVIAAANAANAANNAMAAVATTTTLTTSTSTLQTATVKATTLPNDKAYYVNVTVGSTQMLLNFDTGSSDLWVFSTKLPAAQRGSHKLYPLSGELLSGYTWGLSYQEGSSAAGVIYADKVAIGGVTATIQAVEAATAVSSSFTAGLSDGLVGLGFIEGNSCGTYGGACYGFMHQAGANMPKVLFTATLKHNAPGLYDFGFIDTKKYTGPLTYVNVDTSQGFWEFTTDGYSIGSGAAVADAIDAIADTGTSLALIDDDILANYYAAVPGAAYNSAYAAWIFPCTSNSKLPSLSFYIGGAQHTMPGSYGVYRTMSTPAGYCYGGLQSNAGIGLSILGDVFLKSQFVVFDVCLERIGFAQQAGVVV